MYLSRIIFISFASNVVQLLVNGHSLNRLPLLFRSLETHIISGRDALPGEFPYQLQLRYRNGEHACGATLVLSPKSGVQMALTAAHCIVFLPDPELLQVRAGITQLNETGETLSIEKIVVHPNLSLSFGDGPHNDIAVLHLNGQFALNDNVKPLALPVQGQATTGNLTVSGWGATGTTNEPNNLQTADLPIVESTTCNEWYKEDHLADVVFESNICAGLEKGNKGGCHGDSGGPAAGVEPNGQQKYLVGIVSWGSPDCVSPRRPTVFTRVSSYINWLTEVSP